MRLPHEIERYRVLSLMKHTPVIFGEQCFWCGLYMHRHLAMAIATQMFNNVFPSREMKRVLWDKQYDTANELQRKGCNLGFDINDYEPNRLYGYLFTNIFSKIGGTELYTEWSHSPEKVFWFFVDKSDTYESC